jgi:serine phosphatase RsbU (regulator of sigma subunit)
MANRPRILIVDDEPFNIDYLEQELEDLHYETVSAVNGQEALDKVQGEAPDLLLLDIMMPVMDGFEVLRHLKADAATRDIPVIVISATNDLQSVAKGIELGADDYLPKPFEPVLLRARISSSLEKKRLRDLQQLYLQGLERELDIGREIQMGFLPSELPRPEGWDIAAYFKAAREVAGDFYDAFTLPDGNLACVVGDVCGKGVGAALFMTLFRSLIRVTAAGEAAFVRGSALPLSPAERVQRVVSLTNNYVWQTHGDAGMFATLFMCILDLRSGLLTYANCGNEAPILIRNGSVFTTLRRTGPVVGILPQAEFGVKEITMESGDLLLAFTDGITDAFNEQDASFGNERLVQCATASGTPPSAVLQNVETALGKFVGDAEQFDDITLIALKRDS